MVNIILQTQETETLAHLGPKIWSIVPNVMKQLSMSKFVKQIRKWKPDKCPCRLCKTYIQNLGFIVVSWIFIYYCLYFFILSFIFNCNSCTYFHLRKATLYSWLGFLCFNCFPSLWILNIFMWYNKMDFIFIYLRISSNFILYTWFKLGNLDIYFYKLTIVLTKSNELNNNCRES